VCAFCARLNQRCTWDGEDDDLLDAYPTETVVRPSSTAAAQNAALAARVALLESRLSFLDTDNTFSLFSSIPSATHQGTGSTDEGHGQSLTSGEATQVTDGVFKSLPDPSVFRQLIDVYFNRCHNQPYAYFHEEIFRQDYESGCIPEYLLYAFAATACRFSDLDLYRERQHEAIDMYAQKSFTQIFDNSFSDAEILEVYMVIALAMLAVVEFSGERWASKPFPGWR
jgi:hypothetical protein